MDEKSCRITVHKQNVVFAEKGYPRINLVALEHAENITIAMCVNAVGNAIPPMIIFKVQIRIGIKFATWNNSKHGTQRQHDRNSVFIEFIKHFDQHKVPGKCLLIFDGAKCRLSNEALKEADKSNIVLYILPSYTTHDVLDME